MSTIDLQVDGMSCGSCVKHVTQALQPLPGVRGVEVDLPSGRVRVSGELAQGSAPLLRALTDAGYPAQLATETSIPAATSQPKASGCHSGGTGGCGCR
ncbi:MULTISPECIES: heavy-metal-associated domain-containing protein [Comamonadaceae]|jgi:copper chaperone CopZ|uniref:Copper-binding protein n=2 Tax=Acidovorax carolinensis TaxID=553814 RepID=A0A240U234_9BURK|nr:MULTISPECIES: heavy metal-associated domain-containing protein [Comamonadaceae]ART51451.1 copper-binding protein [Acidovorax carolinensis]MBU4422724.1 heavy-metal-associated domain-containing protein [Gammaproteobacteria bacterium]OYX12452.1 MAG: copper-binding protein [Acidovorax sp. 32-64-7]OZA56326.1 MAG: copper-binding protein [Acidovorax sp. 17-64-282]HQT18626.1 heavy metal-associated domain-containing protein [Acidovorax defluvii]